VISPQGHNFIVLLVKIKVFLLDLNCGSLLMSFWRFRLSVRDAVKHLELSKEEAIPAVLGLGLVHDAEVLP
jgi:hypothetical protein